jgi:hypothetical protein
VTQTELTAIRKETPEGEPDGAPDGDPEGDSEGETDGADVVILMAPILTAPEGDSDGDSEGEPDGDPEVRQKAHSEGSDGDSGVRRRFRR